MTGAVLDTACFLQITVGTWVFRKFFPLYFYTVVDNISNTVPFISSWNPPFFVRTSKAAGLEGGDVIPVYVRPPQYDDG
jgi:hypothetical protein